MRLISVEGRGGIAMSMSRAGSGREQLPSFQWLSLAPAVLTAAGVLIYGALNVAYSLFCGRLGVNAEDVGLGYANTLARSLGFIILIVTLSALGSTIYWRRRALAREELEKYAAHRQAELEAYLEDDYKGAREQVPEDDYKGAREQVPYEIQKDLNEEARRKAQEDIDQAAERVYGASRRTLTVVIWSIAILSLMVVAALVPFLSLPRADAASQGRPVAPVRLFGLTVLAIRADSASVEAVGKSEEAPAIKSLQSRALLYLGQANSTVVLYDSKEKQAVYLPASSVLLRVKSSEAKS
jgi:hypothetical protein